MPNLPVLGTLGPSAGVQDGVDRFFRQGFGSKTSNGSFKADGFLYLHAAFFLRVFPLYGAREFAFKPGECLALTRQEKNAGAQLCAGKAIA